MALKNLISTIQDKIKFDNSRILRRKSHNFIVFSAGL